MAPPKQSEIINILDSPPKKMRPIQTDKSGAILLLSDSEDDSGCEIMSLVEASSKKRSTPNSKSISEKRRKKASAIPSPTSALTIHLNDSDSDSSSPSAKCDLDKKPAARKKKESNSGEQESRLTSQKDDEEIEIEEPDVEEVSNIEKAFRPNANEEEDGECLLVGSKGTNALTDFPHSRENCVLAPIATGKSKSNEKHCANCYCYVCDIPATDCKTWRQHCHARHKISKWQKLREQLRNSNEDGPTTPPTTNVPTPAQYTPRQDAAASGGSDYISNYLNSQMAEAQERNKSRRELETKYKNKPDLDQYSAQQVLKLLVAVYPSEVEPPATVVTKLKHYQKQSVAFMQDVEKSKDQSMMGQHSVTGKAQFERDFTSPLPSVVPDQIKYAMSHGRRQIYHTVGGWLSDEVGMGKTLVVIALAASDGGRPLPSLGINNSIDGLKQKVKVKATVVVTSVSIMGQWEDEVRKHAPTLKCYRFHNSTSKYGMNIGNTKHVKDADIIITSGTFPVASRLGVQYQFNRVVVDEAHLLASSSMNFTNHVRSLCSERRWCVTATPFVSSLRELRYQETFLGLSVPYKITTKGQFYAALDYLRRHLSRHTKDQYIHGFKALVLPKSTTTAVLVEMAASDRKAYDEARRNVDHSSLQHMRSNGASLARLRYQISSLFSMVAATTKLSLLLDDIQKLRLQNPDQRVVVFTQSFNTHSSCIKALKEAGIGTLEFSGSTSAGKRDKVIREFQSPGRGCKAFVITLRSGSVGITLTAASRVYLMEPCIDPATEIQAAGRINRLGQTSKSVEVVKFAFSNSCEQRVVEFHKRIAAGKASMAPGHIPPESVQLLTQGL